MTAETDHRSEVRSNVFLAATLDAGPGAVAARIRNLSARGALVECSELPPVSSKVRLARAALTADGQLVWHSPPYGGINFDAEIDVKSWVRGIGHAGQQRVDGILAAMRNQRRAEEVAYNAESLASLSQALDDVCASLSEMPNMSIELAEEVVRLERICHALRQHLSEK